tara:strand:- start:2832 stop:4112 length:1281 start_codon:yes stop_codon:yes gene_type:complete
MASTTIEIEQSAGVTSSAAQSNLETNTNLDRFNEANTKIYVDRRNSNKFSKVKDVLDNMVTFNTNLSTFFNDIGIPLKPISYSESSDKMKFDANDIAELGYDKYKSFTDYITENVSNDNIEEIKKNGYNEFLNKCFPMCKIVFNKSQYFNVMVLKNGKYTNERGSGERFILFIDGLETKYMLNNQDEREKSVTPTGLKLKDIMPGISFDVKQSTTCGRKSILAIQYIDDIYRLTFLLFKDELVKSYKEGNKIPLSKKLTVEYLNSCDKILFKDKEYIKTNQETNEKIATPFTVYELKLLGTPNNNLQTLITNYTESNTDMMMIHGKSVNLNNIKEALPRGALLTAFVNFEAFTMVHGKTLYPANRAYQIDVSTKHVLTSEQNNKFDHKKFIKDLQKKDLKESFNDIDHDKNNDDDDDDDDEYNDDN